MSIVLLVALGGNVTLDEGEVKWECVREKEMYNCYTEKKKREGRSLKAEWPVLWAGMIQTPGVKLECLLQRESLNAQSTPQSLSPENTVGMKGIGKQHNGGYHLVTVQLHAHGMLFPQPSLGKDELLHEQCSN